MTSRRNGLTSLKTTPIHVSSAPRCALAHENLTPNAVVNMTSSHKKNDRSSAVPRNTQNGSSRYRLERPECRGRHP